MGTEINEGCAVALNCEAGMPVSIRISDTRLNSHGHNARATFEPAAETSPLDDE
jgi:hypothetical protein